MNLHLFEYVYFGSKGFMNPVHVTDFPIRDHNVVLIIRRCRLIDIRTGKRFSLQLCLMWPARAPVTPMSSRLFKKRHMETSQVTCCTLETFYNINAHTFEKQCKE